MSIADTAPFPVQSPNMNFMSIYGTASVPPAKEEPPNAGIRARLVIKTEIRRRVQWLSNDCSTFWRVRLEQPEWYTPNQSTELQPSGLGGGNFVMALALLSACNFLAKAYSILVKPEAFVTEADRQNVTAAQKRVKTELPELKSLFKSSKTDWRPQPKGSCNETAAFARMILALKKEDIDLGLPPEEAEAVWNRFRNQLAHMAHPEGVVEVGAANEGRPLKDAKGAILMSVPAFRLNEGRWVCNADRLSLEVITIAEWLCREVDECSGDARVFGLGEWMFDITEPKPMQDADEVQT